MAEQKRRTHRSAPKMFVTVHADNESIDLIPGIASDASGRRPQKVGEREACEAPSCS